MQMSPLVVVVVVVVVVGLLLAAAAALCSINLTTVELIGGKLKSMLS